MTWAAIDYEPTPEELAPTLAYFAEREDGEHGSVTILPTMEGYLWTVEHIWWAGRRENEDGTLTFDWVCIKQPCRQS